MARDTNRRIEANLRNPEFRKRLEEAKLMVQQGFQNHFQSPTQFRLNTLKFLKIYYIKSLNNTGLIKIENFSGIPLIK